MRIYTERKGVKMTDEEQLKQLLDWELPLRNLYTEMEKFYPEEPGLYDNTLATLTRFAHQECVRRIGELRR